MKASVAGRVRNTSLPKSKALLPLFEAVINSFQSIEDAQLGPRGKIRILVERESNLVDEEAAVIESFTISDNGIGFTEENFESFNIVDSPYKKERGGKGLGRFLWLKAFDRVEIESHFAKADRIVCRRFVFSAAEEEPSGELTRPKIDRPETKVRLVGFLEPYRHEAPRKLEAIAQRVVGHFIPLFLNPNGPAVILSDRFKEIDLREYFRDHFVSTSSNYSFEVCGEQFSLTGLRLYGGVASEHELIYAADHREVIREKLARHMPSLRARLADETQGPFFYLAFVQGKSLDETVNNERTDFSIAREPQSAEAMDVLSSDTDEELSLRAIRERALKIISTDLKQFIDEINRAKSEALVAFVAEDAPQYRPLLKHQEAYIEQIPASASKAELDAFLHKKLYERQTELREEGSSILAATPGEDYPRYYERLKKFAEDFNEIGKTALAEYVLHRRIIIDLLEKALSQNPETGDYALEKTVHSLLFPMRGTSDEVPFEQQNLWIMDERLTFHSYLSSDLPLTSIEAVESDSLARPDIMVFNHPIAFSDEEQPLNSLVLIEFKRPDRTKVGDEDPISQVYRLVRDIRSSKVKDKKGNYIRTSRNDVPAYCYIVCDLTPNVEMRIQNMGARATPDNMGYYGYNETLNAYYEIISYRKLLADAKKRNRILFEKLNLPNIPN